MGFGGSELQQIRVYIYIIFLLQMLEQVKSGVLVQRQGGLGAEEKQRKQKKKKRSSSSRSRSQDGERSRSHERRHQKSKAKDNKQKKRKRERSRSKDHKKHKNHRDNRDRYDQYRDKQHKKERDNRDRELEHKEKDVKKKEVVMPMEIPMPPIEVPMPPIPGEKKKRERSRSPLNYYRRNQNSNEGEFWDSFSWQPRMNYTPTVSNSALANTKKMRRLMVTNIPYQIGITEQDLRNLITRFMAENYLKDQMNSCPVVNLEINEHEKSAAVELSSVQQTCRICKLQKIELFKGLTNGIIRLGDSCYGNNVVTQAQTAAQAQAAAFAAINVLENKKTQFSVQNLRQNNNQTSTLIRAANAVTPYMAGQLKADQWQQYEQDLLQGFSQFGTVIHHWFVKKDEKDICADPGNMFVEYESKEQAQKAMSDMQGRIYDQRSITLYYVPRDVYYKNYKPNITPPVLTDKK